MNHSNSNHDESLKQELLELHYGLLSDKQSEDLRAKIARDPEVATAWAKTLKMANQFADAAKLEEANAGGFVTKPAKHVDEPDTLTRPWPRRRLFDALLASAACIGLLIAGNRYYHAMDMPQPQVPLRITAKALMPSDDSTGQQYRITTSQLNTSRWRIGSSSFRVVPASVSLGIFAGGSKIYESESTTGEDGETEFTVPKQLVIPDGASLRITASSDDESSKDASILIPLEPTRCQTYLTVDRPVYRPGDTIWFRSLTLDRTSMQPNVDVPIRFEMKDPSGALVPSAALDGVTDRGVGNGSFFLPTGLPGGEYTLVARSLDGFFPDESRKLQVRAYRVPRFKKQLEFRRRSYGQGDSVQADFSAQRAEGGPLAGAMLRITATVDGEVVYRGTGQTNDAGAYLVTFDLPSHIDSGEGQLSISVDDGGTQETQAKTIPIQIGRVAVEFFPEGGYLVEGLKNRVYFTARNTLGDPIHIAGEIISSSGQRVAEIETVRDGMGRFELTPTRDERYTLKVASPIDITNSPSLPAVVHDLPVLDTGVGVFEDSKPVELTVRSHKSQALIVQAVCRGKLLHSERHEFAAGATPISIPTAAHMGGVVRVTLLDPTTTPAKPLVERLVYCRRQNELNVQIVSDGDSTSRAARDTTIHRSPGESTRLTLRVTSADGQPTAAILGVSVVDDAALSLDEVERPKLRTHFLLTGEINNPEDLEHANFYLARSEDAERSLDLLLGTQGWRRFASGNEGQPNEDFREQLARLLKLDGSGDEPPAEADNRQDVVSQMSAYLATAERAWRRLLRDVRIVIGPLLLVWLVSLLLRPRRAASVSLGLLLVIGGSWLMIVGCSRPANQRTADAVGESVNATLAMPASDADQDHAFVDESESSTRDPIDADADQWRRPSESEVALRQEVADEMLFGNREAGMGDAGPRSSRPRRGQSIIDEDTLGKLLKARGLDGDSLGKQLLDELRFPIREYAHRHRSVDNGVREDFTETLFWQPLLITDSSGIATIKFDLSDSITTFRVNADAHSYGGGLGSGGGEIVSQIPLQVEPKPPLEVTSGDRIDLPVAVLNRTRGELPLELAIKTGDNLRIKGSATQEFSAASGEPTRRFFSLDVLRGSSESDSQIEIAAKSKGGSLTDVVQRPIHIAPAGYPIRESYAGVLNEQATITLPIPEEIVDGSLAVTLRAYPSPLADLVTGIESILREPHGCFEQTSATNYPNAMAFQYLQEKKLSDPEVTRRAKRLLDKGYAKLTSFECKQLGYEWFGSDPGHEALSAFGLMQFTDMAQIMDIDVEMMVRTRRWLLDRRDGQGGFQRNPRHLHVWSVDQQMVDAYVLWALTEADVASGNVQRGAKELKQELDRLQSLAKQSEDPYFIALSAATLLNVDRIGVGEQLLQKLQDLQGADGMLDGTTTVTQSGGISKKVETTALSVLAWVKSPKFAGPASEAVAWIVKNRQGNGGFGSTQATVLALKAMVAYSRMSTVETSTSTILRVQSGDDTIGSARLPSKPATAQTIEITGLGEKLGHVRSEITLRADGTKNLPFTIEIAYHTMTPPSDTACPLELKTQLQGDLDANGRAPAGAALQVSAVLRNTTEAGLPMTVATIGLPGGLEPRAEQLNEMRDRGVFDFYELRPREVICYWRTVMPGEEKAFAFDVTAAIPGKYTGPASRAYLYYTAEQKFWAKPIEIEISK